MIAHRLSTIADAAQILVMSQGRIVERGSHAELLAKQGVYADMWERQQAPQEDLAGATENLSSEGAAFNLNQA